MTETTPDRPDPLGAVRDVFEREEFDIGELIGPELFDALREALVITTTEDGTALSPTAEQILAERLTHPGRGYDAEHDEGREIRLARAAYCYAEAAAAQIINPEWSGSLHGVLVAHVPYDFPWPAGYWKPSADPIRNLVKAGALAAAAGDALKRKADSE